MLKILATILAVMMSTSAIAQSNTAKEFSKKVVCDETVKVLAFFKEKFGEDVIWIGIVDESKENLSFNAVLANVETETWTAIQFNKDVACIFEAGKKFKFNIPGMQSNQKNML